MPNLEIKHATQSTKPDHPDSSVMSSSEWNAPFVATTGTHGQMVVINGASPTKLEAIDGPAGFVDNDTYNGASPTPNVATVTITCTTSSYIILMINTIVVVSDSSDASIFVKRNNVTQIQYAVNGVGKAIGQSLGIFESPGTYTYTVNSTLGSGNYTNFIAGIVAIKIGAI